MANTLNNPEPSSLQLVDKKDLERLCAVLQYLRSREGKGCNETDVWLDGVQRRDRHDSDVLSLKRLKQSLNILSESLDRVISRVSKSDFLSAGTRITGFASLSDDLVARIMEMAYAQYWASFGFDALKWTITSLSCISKRFRRIAHHYPCLWEDISDDFSEPVIAMLSKRCRNPRVHIDGCGGAYVEDFLRQLHPNSQWKGLVIDYFEEEAGDILLNAMNEIISQPFTKLSSLSIENNGNSDSSHRPTRLSASSDRILSLWNLENLVSLEIGNIIPSKMRVSTLNECRIDLQICPPHGSDTPPFAWDMQALRTLFRSFQTISILSVFTSNASSSVAAVTGSPVMLSNLASFSLQLEHGTEPIVVRQLMGMLHMPNLRKMKILMKYKYRQGTEPPVAKWLAALFRFQGCTVWGKGRVYPKLKEFDINVQDIEGIKLPYENMLLAMPNVSHMSLSLPGFSTVPLHIAPSCLHLRSLRLVNCTSFRGWDAKIPQFLKLPGFEELEVLGYSGFREETLRRRLRGKLVWNATEVSR